MALFTTKLDIGAYERPLVYLPIYNQQGIVCVSIVNQSDGSVRSSGIYNTSCLTDNLNSTVANNLWVDNDWAPLNQMYISAYYCYKGLRFSPYFDQATTLIVTYIGTTTPGELTRNSTDTGW
jgi:hypothetical protein